MGTGYLRGGLCNLVKQGAIYYFLKQPEDVINSSLKNFIQSGKAAST